MYMKGLIMATHGNRTLRGVEEPDRHVAAIADYAATLPPNFQIFVNCLILLVSPARIERATY